MERKKKASNLVKVDRNKLIAELAKRGINMAEASAGIGYSHNYLTSMTAVNRKNSRDEGISQRAVKLLYELYNIRLDSITPDPEPEPEPEVTEPQEGDTFVLNENTLYRILYAAIVHGIRDCAPDIEKAVYNAVKVAWGE